MFRIGLFSEEPVNCPSGELVPKLRAPFEDKRKLNGMVLLLFNVLFFTTKPREMDTVSLEQNVLKLFSLPGIWIYSHTYKMNTYRRHIGQINVTMLNIEIYT